MSRSQPRLFTPGPLTTSPGVRRAMMRDYGSRDALFIQRVREIRRMLLQLGEDNTASFESILMQGSGTFSIESVISSVIPPSGKLLVLANGAYGKRLARIAQVHRIAYVMHEDPEDRPHEPAQVAEKLSTGGFTHLAVVHSETTSGVVNPIEALGALAEQAGVCFIVDAMSSFGGIPISLERAHIDFLISSSNKCIQGVPGFGFVLARRSSLLKSRGLSRTLSLDLFAQWEGLERAGQFRFTPPTHALAAFHTALLELQAEGGVEARHRRYEENHRRVLQGFQALGFVPYLPPERQGPIITSFLMPSDPRFQFEAFYAALAQEGCLIYPGKVSQRDCFRIGHIGHLFPADIERLLRAVKKVLRAFQLPIPLET